MGEVLERLICCWVLGEVERWCWVRLEEVGAVLDRLRLLGLLAAAVAEHYLSFEVAAGVLGRFRLRLED